MIQTFTTTKPSQNVFINILSKPTLPSKVLKISKHITFYTARHTFAKFLKFENTPIDAISAMLGHTDIRTTQAYLNKLPNKKLDKIIDDVFDNSKYF